MSIRHLFAVFTVVLSISACKLQEDVYPMEYVAPEGELSLDFILERGGAISSGVLSDTEGRYSIVDGVMNDTIIWLLIEDASSIVVLKGKVLPNGALSVLGTVLY